MRLPRRSGSLNTTTNVSTSSAREPCRFAKLAKGCTTASASVCGGVVTRAGSGAKSVTKHAEPMRAAIAAYAARHPTRSASSRDAAPPRIMAMRYPLTNTAAPAPSSCSSTTSARYASATTSWLAERNTSSVASTESVTRLPPAAFGPVAAIATSTIANSAWVSSSQPRRRPSVRPNTAQRSMAGAHRNLKVYGSVTRLKSPIFRTSMSSEDSHAVSVSFAST